MDLVKRGLVRTAGASVLAAALVALTPAAGHGTAAVTDCGTVDLELTFMGKNMVGSGTSVGIQVRVIPLPEFGDAVDINAHVNYTGGEIDASFANFLRVGDEYHWDVLVSSSGKKFTATVRGDMRTATAPPKSTPYCVILDLTGSTDTNY
ncbi:MAG: hypothetical protein HOQ24_17535 [Mycobacteriaceae bacterium]|nr:hypothetical protein [Mycobacteriaceae bacterium]